ncbi:MAG: DUF2442 domain-containing protein [Candidatus Margulisiibacteriota bacterium]|jgi:hypothetical protein
MKIHEVIDGKYIKDYIVELVFDDLKKGQVDVKRYLGKGVFKPLLDKNMFKQFWVDAKLGTITWVTGADIAPETLYKDMLAGKK